MINQCYKNYDLMALTLTSNQNTKNIPNTDFTQQVPIYPNKIN